MSSTNRHTIARREFLKHTGLSGIALILGVSFTKGSDAAELVKMHPGDLPVTGLGDLPESFGITPYIIIEPSGKITFINPKPEMGQGTYQSVPALVAEELEVPLDRLTIITSSGQKDI